MDDYWVKEHKTDLILLVFFVPYVNLVSATKMFIVIACWKYIYWKLDWPWCLFVLLRCISVVNLVMDASRLNCCWTIWFPFFSHHFMYPYVKVFFWRIYSFIGDHLFCRYFSFKGGLYLDLMWDRCFLQYFLLLLLLLCFVYSLPESSCIIFLIIWEYQ